MINNCYMDIHYIKSLPILVIILYIINVYFNFSIKIILNDYFYMFDERELIITDGDDYSIERINHYNKITINVPNPFILRCYDSITVGVLKANCDLTLFAQDSNIFIDKLDNRNHKVIFDTNYDVYSNNVLARDFECINLRHGFFVNVTLFRQDEDNNIDINMFTSNWNMKLYIPPIRPIKVTFTRKKPNISLIVANSKKTDKFTYKKPLEECDNNEITTNLKNYKIKTK